MVFFRLQSKNIMFFWERMCKHECFQRMPEANVAEQRMCKHECQRRMSSTIFVRIKIFLRAILARSASGIRNAPTAGGGKESKETRNFKRRKQSLRDQSFGSIAGDQTFGSSFGPNSLRWKQPCSSQYFIDSSASFK